KPQCRGFASAAGTPMQEGQPPSLIKLYTSNSVIHLLHALQHTAPNYLATPEDRLVAADAIRVTRTLMRQPALARYAPEEFLPGPYVADDDVSLAHAAGDIGTTIFHPVGTIKMGPEADPLSPLDARLRMRGIDGLRVIDASIMPTITSGNTNTPTAMIARKGASMVLDDAHRSRIA
ncbi:GMC oxidoreductase, partial [Bradyrhizobium sp. BRP56]|uniref:GMC oxidoreductase n=1 Tax=Bradyrhizobium sp. BRP56 TaxID=2793819 RepID=UPI00201BBB97